MTPMSGIYLIRHRASGKFYVGRSITLMRRWDDHSKALRAGQHSCRHLQNAWNKYGEDDFEFVVLGYLDPDMDILTQAEQRELDKWFGTPMCYNTSSKAEGLSREQCSEAGRSGAASQKVSGTGLFGMTREDHVRLGRQAFLSGQLLKAATAGGHTQGRKNVEDGHLDRIRSHDGSVRAGKLQGRRNVENGHLAKARRGALHSRWHLRRGIVNPQCPLCQEI